MMAEEQLADLIRRASDPGFRQGYEIANRTPIDESIGKDNFINTVLDTVLNSLDRTIFKDLSAELDAMNEKYPAFDSWKVFADGVVRGAGENFSDRTGEPE
jgi:hypothetical protein